MYTSESNKSYKMDMTTKKQTKYLSSVQQMEKKKCYTVEELVHVALKAKVTSHYDLGVKVIIYTLPAGLTFPAFLSTVC